MRERRMDTNRIPHGLTTKPCCGQRTDCARCPNRDKPHDDFGMTIRIIYCGINGLKNCWADLVEYKEAIDSGAIANKPPTLPWTK